jgi:histidinol-phosphate phosphatase family protein
MPRVRSRLRRIPWSADGPWLAIASNQNGVAAGELSVETARALMEEMLEEALGFIPERARIEMCICEESADCGCRKPAPGLLMRLLAHFGVAAGEAVFVGDLDSDAEAARRAGIRFIRAQDFFC